MPDVKRVGSFEDGSDETNSENRTSERLNPGVFMFAMLFATISRARC